MHKYDIILLLSFSYLIWKISNYKFKDILGFKNVRDVWYELLIYIYIYIYIYMDIENEILWKITCKWLMLNHTCVIYMN